MVGLRVFGRGLTTTPVLGPSVPLRLSLSLIIQILSLRAGLHMVSTMERRPRLPSISKAAPGVKERILSRREKTFNCQA
jgi:hypothetical protein